MTVWGPLARLGPKTAFVAVGGRGSCLANERRPFEAASLANLWINVTLPGSVARAFRFYHSPKSKLTRARMLHG